MPSHGHPRAPARPPSGRWPEIPRGLIDTYHWETELGDSLVQLTGAVNTRKVWHEPVGVVGAIVPWNYPFEVTIHKLGQALATGNTVILKPAPDTPFNATRIGRLICEQTDIPAGVVNVVTSSDHLVGEELTLSPEGRPDFIHRFDIGWQEDHGKGCSDHEAVVPGARGKVGRDRARRR